MNKKQLTASQENWRQGYFAGVKATADRVDDDEKVRIRRDAYLLRIIKSMGLPEWWSGWDQAIEILNDAIDQGIV